MRRTLAPLALALLAGCGGNDSTLTGRVSHRGKPVTSGVVVVLNPDGSAAKGAIEPDGSYRVSGVGRGTVKVAVLSPDPAGRAVKPAGSRQRPTPPKPDWVRLPESVGNPGTSGIRFDVSGSGAHPIAIN